MNKKKNQQKSKINIDNTNIDSTLDYLELNRMCQFKDIYRRRLSRSMVLFLRRKIFTVCKQAQGLELLFEN